MDIYRPPSPIAASTPRVNLRTVMQEVYTWMTLGLMTSAAVAVLFAVTGLTAVIAPAYIVFLFVELGLVWYLAARIQRIPAQRATTMFLIYAALNGATLSVILYYFTLADISIALFSTGAMFAAMSIIGYTTDVDLSRLGSLLIMALIGLIVASIANLFFASSALYWLVSYAGVIIFSGLTAYDTQRIKNQALAMDQMDASSDTATLTRRVGILGALVLYLDFVNLFLFMLRIVGGRRS
ncbi:Bax inhibitor-1/YccA family protein [Aggregatilinea lenta]|uniref:Bax inhibitor-1/YccA family protein n=1 Tax=Aggregatilinea lenta TaxID=913108 RepID=UPI000E5AF5E0|nr:Bax inhibitor-1/YccA family protein [Aggregatilinea lenta]